MPIRPSILSLRFHISGYMTVSTGVGNHTRHVSWC